MNEEVVPVGIAAEASRTSIETVEDSTPAVIPLLGLVVSLDNPPEVAKALDAVRDAKRQLDAVRGELERVLVEEASRQGLKTLHFGDLTAEITGGPTTEYDVQVLEELQEAGLPEERYEKLVRTEITYKVDRSVIRQLLGSGNPDYVRVIENATQHVERPYRVSVR